ncbi:SDR family oxidoreductase [Methylosinus sp. Sm6]|uniref:SDR family oxidoreductase n=1 Tax=Methylosinus sp. Sm6 TaxID=2866948 RepID=UPI001C9969C9|nr:SDR family oxidoreductase [Methylosinus sp. Sm6]MBY6239627.1 SDR family oxidoreductase [Methylosinus sp. Sm6]
MSIPHTVIVGGSSGVGLATARTLLYADHDVTIAGRSRERLDAASRELGGRARAIVLDAADPASAKSAFAALGAFDHLVLALGSAKGVGPFASVDLAEVRRGFEEKVFAHFATAQAALPFLAEDGSMTFVAAVTAHAAMPAGIGAANAAVAALAPILAAELKPLRVNGVSPGVIDTPWWDVLADEVKESAFADYAAMAPVGRIGRADDIAETIAFLIANSFMTGAVIVCDGGLRLGPGVGQ